MKLKSNRAKKLRRRTAEVKGVALTRSNELSIRSDRRMRNEEGLNKIWLLLLVCLCFRISASGLGCEGPAATGTPLTQLDVVVPIKNRGGLAAFVKSANSSRYSVLSGDFDYKVLSEEIAQV